jgi:hypothetical protein
VLDLQLRVIALKLLIVSFMDLPEGIRLSSHQILIATSLQQWYLQFVN